MTTPRATHIAKKKEGRERASKMAKEVLDDLRSMQDMTPEQVLVTFEIAVEEVYNMGRIGLAANMRGLKALWLMYGSKRHRNAYKYREEKKRATLELSRTDHKHGRTTDET